MDGCCRSLFPLVCSVFLHSFFIFIFSFVSFYLLPVPYSFTIYIYSFIHVDIWFWLHHLFFLVNLKTYSNLRCFSNTLQYLFFCPPLCLCHDPQTGRFNTGAGLTIGCLFRGKCKEKPCTLQNNTNKKQTL